MNSERQIPGSNATAQPLLAGAEIVSQGVDWYTATSDNPGTQATMKLYAARAFRQQEALGQKKTECAFQGYKGALCGDVFIGQRADGFLIRQSGAGAVRLLEALRGLDHHATRIDLQVTLRLPADREQVAAALGRHRADLAADRKVKLAPKQNLRVGYGEGDTLYIGSRHSPRFGRVYDKWRQAEDDDYRYCWRFELEYKKLMAPKVADAVGQAVPLASNIVEILQGQFEAWDIVLPLSSKPLLVAGSIGRREFDQDRSLDWLKSQVAPTVERLLGRVTERDVLEALGLVAPDIGRAWEPGDEEPVETDLWAGLQW